MAKMDVLIDVTQELIDRGYGEDGPGAFRDPRYPSDFGHPITLALEKVFREKFPDHRIEVVVSYGGISIMVINKRTDISEVVVFNCEHGDPKIEQFTRDAYDSKPVEPFSTKLTFVTGFHDGDESWMSRWN